MKPLRSYEDVKETAKARRETKAAMRKPMKKVNEKRKGQRFPQEHLRDPDYLAWLRLQPCIVCGLRMGQVYGHRLAMVEAAHMRSKGAGGDDSSALPLESVFHREQHRVGIRSFAKFHELDIPALIAAHRKRYALEMAEKIKARVTQ